MRLSHDLVILQAFKRQYDNKPILRIEQTSTEANSAFRASSRSKSWLLIMEEGTMPMTIPKKVKKEVRISRI